MPLQDNQPTAPNPLKARDPELLKELKRFRGRIEDVCLAPLDAILDDRSFRNRGHFLATDDLRAVAQALRVLTKDTWTEQDVDLFGESWRDAMRCDLFADEVESSRFRIQSAVEAARNRFTGEETVITQPSLW